MYFLSLLVTAVYYLVELLSILIVVRALVSWLPLSEDNKFNSFLVLMTEPIMDPIRRLLYKFEFTRELPVDFSPIVAIILLGIISSILKLL